MTPARLLPGLPALGALTVVLLLNSSVAGAETPVAPPPMPPEPQSESPSQPAAAEGSSEPEALDTVYVAGSRAYSRYQARSARGALRSDAPLLETPASVTVITRELMDDQNATLVTDLYRNIASISEFSYSGVSFRGFRQEDVRYNGVIGDPYAGFDVPTLWSIDRVEVLKGPSTVLYGPANPGGLINYASKQPSLQRSQRGTLAFDTLGGRQGTLEFTGPVADRDDTAFRLGGFYEDSEGFRDGTAFDRFHVTAALAHELGHDTRMTVELESIQFDLAGHRLRGVPVGDDSRFRVAPAFNVAEPDDRQQLDSQVAQLRLDHQAGPVRIDATLRWVDVEALQNYHEPFNYLGYTVGDPITADVRTITRQYRDQDRFETSLASVINAQWDTSLLGMDQTWVGGVDWAKQESDFLGVSVNPATCPDDFDPVTDRPTRCTGGPLPIDLFRPEYGLTSPADYGALPRRASGAEQERLGVYLQNQLHLTERLQLLGGLRYDRFEDSTRPANTRFDDSAVTFRAGLLYQARPNISVYGVGAQGFVPQSVANQSAERGGPFDPVESELIEFGAKSEWLDSRLLVTASLFQITQTNTLQNADDPDNADLLRAVGEVEARGVELEVQGRPTERLNLLFAYAYNDVEVTRDRDPARIGMDFPNTPDQKLGLYTRYDLGNDAAVGLGVDWVDVRTGFDARDVAPAYALADLTYFNRIGAVDLSVGVKNLFDREYAISSFSVRGILAAFPGEPRHLYVTTGYRFD